MVQNRLFLASRKKSAILKLKSTATGGLRASTIREETELAGVSIRATVAAGCCEINIEQAAICILSGMLVSHFISL